MRNNRSVQSILGKCSPEVSVIEKQSQLGKRGSFSFHSAAGMRASPRIVLNSPPGGSLEKRGNAGNRSQDTLRTPVTRSTMNLVTPGSGTGPQLPAFAQGRAKQVSSSLEKKSLKLQKISRVEAPRHFDTLEHRNTKHNSTTQNTDRNHP